MPLTREQLDLLHALHDGQCAGPELAVAQQLARTPEGAAVLADLAALSALVRTHGATRAPVGLKGRVFAAMDEDFDDISRPTASILPMRRVFMLAAACLALAFGVYVTVSVISNPTQPVAPTIAVDAPGIANNPVPLPPAGIGTSPVPTPPVTPPGNDGTEPEPLTMARDGAPKVTVLNMDRGHSDDLLSIELDRNGNRNALQTYTDLLAVACLHADARLIDAQGTDTSADNDFTAFGGLEVELLPDALPALLSAMRKLSQDQQLGVVQVPEDLEQPVGDTDRLVADLVEARNDGNSRQEADDSSNESLGRGQDYLPPAVLAERLKRNEAGKGGDWPGPVGTGGGGKPKRENTPDPERKVKLVIRLQ